MRSRSPASPPASRQGRRGWYRSETHDSSHVVARTARSFDQRRCHASPIDRPLMPTALVVHLRIRGRRSGLRQAPPADQRNLGHAPSGPDAARRHARSADQRNLGHMRSGPDTARRNVELIDQRSLGHAPPGPTTVAGMWSRRPTLFGHMRSGPDTARRHVPRRPTTKFGHAQGGPTT
jgi:hypothetical protein